MMLKRDPLIVALFRGFVFVAGNVRGAVHAGTTVACILVQHGKLQRMEILSPCDAWGAHVVLQVGRLLHIEPW